ncbi:hypothetical protein O7608_22705 [Solwaraspora sp. WMMA2056]|uniref:hypothetical protein n=1 Tax=Solwaraspora sp. WMMA2056 TaxID=3015161 RepID=UPI00259B9223|nr:hypothetical protein [Solwaraspora sp. WMMA2056]WJK39261.1 hypothetical protein O7608_22705 [Solwaraspora sp. WMMA2056]
MTRLLFGGGVWCCAVVAGLMLPLIWLDAVGHEGYRPERAELATAARVVAAGLGLGVGYLVGVRSSPGLERVAVVRRWAIAAGAGAGAAVAHLVADEATYRYVIPVESARVDGTDPVAAMAWAWLVGALLAVGAATVGFGIGLFRRDDTRGRGRGWYAVAAAGAVAGLLAVPEFVRVGAELATARFLPAGFVTVPVGQPVPVVLPTGRSAIFRDHGQEWSAEDCQVTDSGGARIRVRAPSVPFTDNSDSIVTVVLGTVEVSSTTSVTVECQGLPGQVYQVGAAPTVDGPLGPLLHVPAWVLPVGGALPGLVLAVAVALVRRGQSSARQR